MLCGSTTMKFECREGVAVERHFKVEPLVRQHWVVKRRDAAHLEGNKEPWEDKGPKERMALPVSTAICETRCIEDGISASLPGDISIGAMLD